MSVRLMSLVFEADIPDLTYIKNYETHKSKASTAKLLLLAIADHANDEGESAYPGYTRLEKKTCLSRQGISDTLESLKQNNYLSISGGPSKLGTNNYTVNINTLVKPLDYHQSSHLTTLVKPLDYNHQLTITEPSIKEEEEKTATMKNVFAFYQDNIAMLTSFSRDEIGGLIDEYSAHWVTEAFKDCVEHNARSLKYAKSILASWKKGGFRVDTRPKAKNKLQYSAPAAPARHI